MKSIRTLVGFLVVLTLVSVGLRGEQPHGFVSVKVWDHYLSYRLGTAPTRTPVIWGEAELLLPNGLYMNSFGSYPISGSLSQQRGNQVDFALGRRWALERSKIKFDFNIRYSNIDPIGHWSFEDLGYINLVASRDFQISSNQIVRPHIYTEWMGRLSNYRGGALLEQIGFTYTYRQPFGIRCLTVSDCNSFSYAGAWGKIPEAFYFRSDLAFNWKIGNRWDIIFPGCRFVHGFDHRRKPDKSLWAGIKLGF